MHLNFYNLYDISFGIIIMKVLNLLYDANLVIKTFNLANSVIDLLRICLCSLLSHFLPAIANLSASRLAWLVRRHQMGSVDMDNIFNFSKSVLFFFFLLSSFVGRWDELAFIQ